MKNNKARWKEIQSQSPGRKAYQLILGNTCLGEIHPVIARKYWIVKINGDEYRQPSKEKAKRLILKKQNKPIDQNPVQ